MRKPTGTQFAANAVNLPSKRIPYVANGSTLSGMDCQGLMEYLLKQVGINRNWAGSNAMWRDMGWTGTPEECMKKFGCIPVGAWLFIWEENGAPAKYTDGLGNANHVGVKTGNGHAVHASASRKRVVDSVFKDKTIKNGGWNRVGLPEFLDYGFTVCELASDVVPTEQSSQTVVTSVDVNSFYTVKKGCKGGAVRRLQTWLVDLGFDIGNSGCDGDFGNKTDAAVRQFQANYALGVDGVVGQKTWTALSQARNEAMKSS